MNQGIKILVYMDGTNELDRKGVSVWNLSVCICKVFLNSLSHSHLNQLLLVYPECTDSQFKYLSKLPVNEQRKETTADIALISSTFQNISTNTIKDSEIKGCFGQPLTFGEIYKKNLERDFSESELKRLKAIVLNKVGKFSPDIIINYPLDLFFLREVFPSKLIMINEWAIFSRSPLPETVYFDPYGGVAKNFLSRFAKEIKEFKATDEELTQLEELKQELQKFFIDTYPISSNVKEQLKRWNRIILVPLVGCGYAEGLCPFSDDEALIEYVMEKTSPDVGVVFTGHQGVNSLSRGHLYNYKRKWKNFLFFPELQRYSMSSISLFPYVDAVLNLFSQTGTMALLWNLPVVPLGGDYNTWFQACNSIDELSEVIEKKNVPKNNELVWYLTHYAVFENKFENEPFWNNYFRNKLIKYQQGIDFDFYEKNADMKEVAEVVSKRLFEARKNCPQERRSTKQLQAVRYMGRVIRRLGKEISKAGQILIDRN